MTYRPPQPFDWVDLGMGLAFVLCIGVALGLPLVNLFGPCEWLMWQPITHVPARCLEGLPR